MINKISWLCRSFLLLIILSSNAYSASLCTPTESVLFSCKIEGTTDVVSLCYGYNPGMAQNDKWMQFRYGSARKTKLIYPKQKSGSFSKFIGSRQYSRDTGDGESVSIASVAFRYHDQTYLVGTTVIGGLTRYEFIRGPNMLPQNYSSGDYDSIGGKPLKCAKGQGRVEEIASELELAGRQKNGVTHHSTLTPR